jgi:pimeloyl-ACP methyl ester carboxylesterase
MNWVFLAVGIAILYQAAVLVLITVGWRNPRARHRKAPSSMGIDFEEVCFPTAGGKTLYGWWISCGASGAPVVILVHGWGRNVQRMLPYVKMLHPAGFDLLAFDARHHGSSDEDDYASMPKFAEDILAGVDWVERRCGTEVHIGVLGLSVGGSAAILASSRDERITAVATVGAFADPRDPRATLGRFWWILGPGLPLAFRFVEWRMGLRFKSFAPQNVIGRSRCPFLLIHGSEDTVIPLRHARRLAAAAGASARLWIIPGRNHSDPHLEPGMADTLAAFFRDTLDGAHVAAMGK